MGGKRPSVGSWGIRGYPCSGVQGIRVSEQFHMSCTMRTEPPWPRPDGGLAAPACSILKLLTLAINGNKNRTRNRFFIPSCLEYGKQL